MSKLFHFENMAVVRFLLKKYDFYCNSFEKLFYLLQTFKTVHLNEKINIHIIFCTKKALSHHNDFYVDIF